MILLCVHVSEQDREISPNPPLSDLVKLLWVVNEDLDPHLHFGLLQAEVQASNLRIYDTLHHSFGSKQCIFITGKTRRQQKQTSHYETYVLQFNSSDYSIVWPEEMPQFTHYCDYAPFKANSLSPTRITAYAIKQDIAANLNGSFIRGTWIMW